MKQDFPAIGQRTFLVDARRIVHPDDNSPKRLPVEMFLAITTIIERGNNLRELLFLADFTLFFEDSGYYTPSFLQ
ncbi:UNVERIFIED_ORG: hypothetical protein GGI63_001862 [Rhizobium esperanzae]